MLLISSTSKKLLSGFPAPRALAGHHAQLKTHVLKLHQRHRPLTVSQFSVMRVITGFVPAMVGTMAN